jgi:1-deoxy-D-xylulose-5-phosphate reductoisomerase
VFRAYRAGVNAGKAGGTAPAVFNAVNEVAVARFLEGRLPFGRIASLIESVLARHQVRSIENLRDVQSADEWARAAAESEIG